MGRPREEIDALVASGDLPAITPDEGEARIPVAAFDLWRSGRVVKARPV